MHSFLAFIVPDKSDTLRSFGMTNFYSKTEWSGSHYENTPIQIYWKFYLQKHKIFG